MRPDEATLSRLAKESQRGDRLSYAALLESCATWLGRYYARRIAPGQLDDLVQETLISIHHKFASYDDSRPFLPWMAAIARYRWVDALRKAYRTAEYSIDDESVSVEPNQEAVAARLSLERLLSLIPRPQACVIELVKIEGLSVREAAEAAGQSEALVKVNIHRGLKKLQAMIEKVE